MGDFVTHAETHPWTALNRNITRNAQQGGGFHVLDTFSKIFFFKNLISEEPRGPTTPKNYLRIA